MFKDFFRLIRLVTRLYWPAIAIWVLAQVALIATLRSATVVTETGDKIPPEPSETKLFLLLGAIAFSYMILLIFLGFIFSSGQRGNGLRQLPFRAFSLSLLPCLMIFCYGTALLFLIPWGAFSSGVSVGVLGIPFALFLILKNARHFLLGLLTSAAAGLGLTALWAYLYFEWSLITPQFTVEATALVVFTVIALLFGRRERHYVLVPAALSVLLLTVVAAYRENRAPENFSQAVLDHAFRPTEKTALWFKKIALDSEYWKSAEQFHLPLFVNYRAQEFAKSLSNEEMIQYIKNIDSNNELFKDAILASYRPLRFAVFWQPSLRLLVYNKIPVYHGNISSDVDEYLYSHWRDSMVFCALIKPERTARFLEKAFTVSDCALRLAENTFPPLYFFFGGGEFEKMVDRFMIDAFKKSPLKNRIVLSYWLLDTWLLPDTPYRPMRSKLFQTEELTPDLLERLKKDRAREPLTCVKRLPRERNAFARALTDGSLRGDDCKRLGSLLDQVVLGDESILFNKLKNERISLVEGWRRRWQDPFFVDQWATDAQIQEVLKIENWPKIEKLFAYVDNRSDL